MGTVSLDPRRRQGGFTLVELVVVMVLLGIIAAVIGARWGGPSENLGAQADQLAADIRYTQSLSQTRAQRYCIGFAAASYTVTNTNCATVVTLPTSANPVVLDAGITLTAGNPLLTFNTLGQPFTDAAATTPLAAESVITLSGGGQSITVRVTPVTGRVRVQ